MMLRPDSARIVSSADRVDVELVVPAPVSPDYQVRHVSKPVLPLDQEEGEEEEAEEEGEEGEEGGGGEVDLELWGDLPAGAPQGWQRGTAGVPTPPSIEAHKWLIEPAGIE